MSDNNSSSDSSNDSEYNVLLGFLGLTGHTGGGRYVKDSQALADEAEEMIKNMVNMRDQRVDTVAVRSNWEVCQILQERFDTDSHPDVDYFGIDWRRVLDDVDNVDDDTGDVLAEGVMQDDDQPVAELMAEAHDDFDPDEFDLNDRDDRNSIDYSVLEQSRITRAKAYAVAKTDERLYNTYEEFDDPNVKDAVFFNDGTDRGTQAFENARSQNAFATYPSYVPGVAVDVNCNKDDHDIIDWARYFADTDRENLSDSQIDDLRSRFSDQELSAMDIEPETETSAPAAAEAEPVPAGAD